MATGDRKEITRTLFDCLPKNFSYEENYHQKYYYPKLVLEKIKRRYAAMKPVNYLIEGGAVCKSSRGSLSDSLPSLEKIASFCESTEELFDNLGSGHNGKKRASSSCEDSQEIELMTKRIGMFLYDGDSDGELNSSASSEEHGRSREDCTSTSSHSSKESGLIIYYPTAHDRNYTRNGTRGMLRKRSSSLKSLTGLKPVRKKSVRFADALGLDLQLVKTITNTDQPPVLPNSALRDLWRGLEEAHKTEGTRHICLCFRQPGEQFDFLDRVKRQKVTLESIVSGAQDSTVTGTVRVKNMCHHKEVIVRYTINRWVTFDDIYASYVMHSNDRTTDRFSFTITLPRCMLVGGRLTFAIKYTAVDIQQVYWDSNYGENYHLECYAKSVPTRESDSAWMHFL